MAKKSLSMADMTKRFLSGPPEDSTAPEKKPEAKEPAAASAVSEEKTVTAPVMEAVPATAPAAANTVKKEKTPKEETCTQSFRVTRDQLTELRIQAGYKKKGDMSSMLRLGIGIVLGLDDQTFADIQNISAEKGITPAEYVCEAVKQYKAN